MAPPAALAVSQPPWWPHPCGTAIVPAIDLVGDPRLGLDLAVRGGDPDAVAVADPGRVGVGGVEPGAVDPVAGHQLLGVVHPRVVGAELAQADQPQREALVAVARPRRSGRPRRRSRAGRGGRACRRGGSCPPGRRARARRRGRSPCGASASLPRLRPPRRRPKRSPSGPSRSSRSISRRGAELDPGPAEPAGREHALGDDPDPLRDRPR